MRNYFKSIQWIASLTACSILVFQAVWVYRTYQSSQENFRIRSTQALKRSVDQYLLDHIHTPVSLSGPAPMLYVVNTISSEGKGEVLRTLHTPFDSANPVKINFHPLPIDTANLETVRLFVAQMIVLSKKEDINIRTLEKYFHKELARGNIGLAFKLSLAKPKGKDRDRQAITVALGNGKGDLTVTAIPVGTSWHLLAENLGPALVSLSLILLTAGCLWYMGQIIARQRGLDEKKNDFIDNLAHELRTPVTILKTTNEALLDFGQSSDVDKITRYLQFNAEVLDKLESGIDRLLRIRQYELGAKGASLSSVDISTLIYTAANGFKTDKEDRILITVELHQETIFTDAEIIKDIVNNLIDNALKYANGPALVNVAAVSTDNGWQLIVEDNGIGINEESLPLIFDKFYRVDTGYVHNAKGYGIGLSYVKQLVQQLGGHIKVSSEPGIGTKFIITFPI